MDQASDTDRPARAPRRHYLGGILPWARAPQAFDPDVVRPWRLGDGPRGVLLLHGYAGSPPELRRLGEHMAANGWRCSGPALAGHGTTTKDMSKTGWHDWVASARAALDELSRQCSSVAVVGQSMGGTIALHLAATDERVQAVATLAAPVRLGGPWPVVLPLARFVYPWHHVADPPPPADADPADAAHNYSWRSNRTVIELFELMRTVRRELYRVHAPVLIAHGGADVTIDPGNSAAIERGLVHSTTVERVIYPESGHALAAGVDRDQLNRRVLDWFNRFC